ncbi:MAG: Thymidylate kinase [Parcubacteria group bacterium ADurb.Bin305]|jgi:dTMP kinase|nr:thymidylate kinase [Candidatus Paceibacterota bacterium]OQA44460.1 MAG: Thymidylate kinase [Parcubacteria group bacterium ADurb.Bin305]
MTKNKRQKGRLIALEGIDGCGKSTQIKLLKQTLRRKGYHVKFIDLPSHGEPSAYFVDKFLKGKFGSIEIVGPYRAAIFFALDRYDKSFLIKQWLNEGFIVLADRYLGSNLAYQGAHFDNPEHKNTFINWLFDLEYNIFQIPKPDLNIVLDVPSIVTQKLITQIKDRQKIKTKETYLGKAKKDLYEKNVAYQETVRQIYLELTNLYPQFFKIIPCYQNNQLLTITKIHHLIWQKVEALLS